MRGLPDRILCLVTDLGRAGGEEPLLRDVADAVRGGVNMVQVRAHELDREQLTRLATNIVETVSGDALTIVNGSSEIAAAAGADGVHSRESVRLDRPSTGLLTGQSVHSTEAARSGQRAGADYLVVGTIFPSESHPGGVAAGPGLVRRVTAEVELPVIGIGGITAENAREVIASGASGVAVIGAIIGTGNSFEAARVLAAAIGLPVKR